MRCGGLAKGKPKRECCCSLVPKVPEQQPGLFVARRSWGPELPGLSQEVTSLGGEVPVNTDSEKSGRVHRSDWPRR